MLSVYNQVFSPIIARTREKGATVDLQLYVKPKVYSYIISNYYFPYGQL